MRTPLLLLRRAALALRPQLHPRPQPPPPPPPHPLLRAFTSTPTSHSKQLPPRRPLLDAEIIETFLKGSGPGGQKINKTASAVQLKHIPTGIVVKCQETRSRSTNRKFARRILQDRIEEMELGEGARTRVVGREKAERKKSAAKKKRRKYRRLAEGGEVEEGEVDGVVEGGEKDGDVEGTVDGQAGNTSVSVAGKAG